MRSFGFVPEKKPLVSFVSDDSNAEIRRCPAITIGRKRPFRNQTFRPTCRLGNVLAGRETRIVFYRTTTQIEKHCRTPTLGLGRRASRRQAKRGSNGHLDPNSSDRFSRFAGILSVSVGRLLFKFLRGADLRSFGAERRLSKEHTCTHANVPNRRENNNKVTKAHFPPAAAAAVTRV